MNGAHTIGLVPERQSEMAPQHNATARWWRQWRRRRSGRRRRRGWRNVFDQRWRPSDSVGVVVFIAARTTTATTPSSSSSAAPAAAAPTASTVAPPRLGLPRWVDSTGKRRRNDPLISRLQRRCQLQFSLQWSVLEIATHINIRYTYLLRTVQLYYSTFCSPSLNLLNDTYMSYRVNTTKQSKYTFIHAIWTIEIWLCVRVCVCVFIHTLKSVLLLLLVFSSCLFYTFFISPIVFFFIFLQILFSVFSVI